MIHKKERLIEYIKANVAPILVDFVKGEDFEGAVTLAADIDTQELNCHYEGEKCRPPKWLEDIINKEEKSLLIIDKIDKISKEEQLKFGEILKYRKVNTYKLPENCVIMVTADKINKDTINENIFSLVAKI